MMNNTHSLVNFYLASVYFIRRQNWILLFSCSDGCEIRSELRRRKDKKNRQSSLWFVFTRSISLPVNNFTRTADPVIQVTSFLPVTIPWTTRLISPMTVPFHIIITSLMVTWQDLCRRRWIAQPKLRENTQEGFYYKAYLRLRAFKLLV